MEVKICGITKVEEAEYLNFVKADYAGFVFFEKSKRNVSLETAQNIFKKLDPSIKKVAVTVAPSVVLTEVLSSGGFDVLQVHKELSTEVLEASKIPVWYAVNISEASEIEMAKEKLLSLPKELASKITGIVVDAQNYGGGKTFDWQKSLRLKDEYKDVFAGRTFILAGGLNPENVGEGISFFEPDMVDVSSGVEGKDGKSFELIKKFISAAKG